MLLNKELLGLLIVKYEIIPLFGLSFWIVKKKTSPERPFYGNINIFRYILLILPRVSCERMCY